MNKLRCIIKRPDEQYGHVTAISDSLKNLQKTVEGHIETVPIGNNMVILCNEEGKILNLEKNFVMGFSGLITDVIRGTVIVIGTDGDKFSDLQMEFSTWKKLLKDWGN